MPATLRVPLGELTIFYNASITEGIVSRKLPKRMREGQQRRKRSKLYGEGLIPRCIYGERVMARGHRLSTQARKHEAGTVRKIGHDVNIGHAIGATELGRRIE